MSDASIRVQTRINNGEFRDAPPSALRASLLTEHGLAGDPRGDRVYEAAARHGRDDPRAVARWFEEFAAVLGK